MSRKVVAEPLSATGFEPFGWLPVADTDPADSLLRMEFAWNDPHVNMISHGPGEISRVPDGIVCDQMFRHVTHTQALLILDNESVVAVAPSDVDFSAPEDADAVRAFTLKMHDAFVLHRGTWHWGPFPLQDMPVHLYNVQGKGYERDNERVDLSAFGLVVEA